MSGRTQHVNGCAAPVRGWSDLTVVTRAHGELESTTLFQRREGHKFLDVAIEEHVGVSRRLKAVSVRLDPEAARALLDMLKPMFEGDR